MVTLTYYYGMNGVVGFHYVNLSKDIDENYYFGKNAFGDVTAIYNEAGTAVAGYTYDAWGNIIDKYDYSTYSIGARNPIRYRSYYYDTETNLYYIGGRYYDLTTGRFINAADVNTLDISSIYGPNLYLYCSNPIPLAKGNSKVGYHESVGLGCVYDAVNQRLAGDSFKWGPFFGEWEITKYHSDTLSLGTEVAQNNDGAVGLFADISALNISGELGVGQKGWFSDSYVGSISIGNISSTTGIIFDPEKQDYLLGIGADVSAISASYGRRFTMGALKIELGVQVNILSFGGRIGLGYSKDEGFYGNMSGLNPFFDPSIYFKISL